MGLNEIILERTNCNPSIEHITNIIHVSYFCNCSVFKLKKLWHFFRKWFVLMLCAFTTIFCGIYYYTNYEMPIQ